MTTTRREGQKGEVLTVGSIVRTPCTGVGAEVPESATVYYNRERDY